MNTNELLANVRVASPCSARWGHMVGDNRVRHCLQCNKNVYNFSAMTEAEIAELIREREGKVCARFYRRADGTMLTADCPMGAGRFWRAVKTRLTAAAALLALSATVAVASRTDANQAPARTPRTNKLTLLWDNAKFKVQTWFGYKQPQFVMGDICPPPAPTPLPQQKSN